MFTIALYINICNKYIFCKNNTAKSCSVFYSLFNYKTAKPFFYNIKKYPNKSPFVLEALKNKHAYINDYYNNKSF